MPSTIPTREHGIALRREEFRQLDHIQRKLEARHETIEFEDDNLGEVSIVRGTPFDIDEDDPIDLDPRYFLPGPAEKTEYGIDAIQKAEGLMRCTWPQATPIEHHLLRDGPEVDCRLLSDDSLWDARARAGFCERAADEDSDWMRHLFMCVTKRPSYHDSQPSPVNGRPSWQMWSSGAYYMWSHGRGKSGYSRDVPHAVATAYDMARPLHHGLLRSELLVAVSVLKAQLRWPDRFLDHHVCPALVVSFHGRFTARVLQAYLHNGRIVIRASRLLNLYTRAISPDVRLVVRWLNSRPVGDTRLPASTDDRFDDEAASTVEVKDSEKPLSRTVAAR